MRTNFGSTAGVRCLSGVRMHDAGESPSTTRAMPADLRDTSPLGRTRSTIRWIRLPRLWQYLSRPKAETTTPTSTTTALRQRTSGADGQPVKLAPHRAPNRTFSSSARFAPDQISYSQPCCRNGSPGQAGACTISGSCNRSAGLTLTTRTVPEGMTSRKSGTWCPIRSRTRAAGRHIDHVPARRHRRVSPRVMGHPVHLPDIPPRHRLREVRRPQLSYRHFTYRRVLVPDGRRWKLACTTTAAFAPFRHDGDGTKQGQPTPSEDRKRPEGDRY